MSWATQTLQWTVQRVAKPQGGANRIKTVLSWDCSLKFDCMNAELLVIVDQHATVNTFSGLVHTACQVMEAGFTRRVSLDKLE
jgi:hypothetical protein